MFRLQGLLVGLAIGFAGVIGFFIILFPVIIPTLFERELTPIETGFVSVLGLMISIYVTYYFTKERKDFTKYHKHLHMTHYSSDRMGLVKVEPSLQLGTRAECAAIAANISISFLGIAGSKFLKQILNERTPIGRKILSGNVKLRLLLLNPDGVQIKRWTRNSKQIEKTQKSINKSIDLVERIKPPGKDNIQYRLYDYEPPMRILIIDDYDVYVSRYSADSKNGWEIPQLCFTSRNAVFPMSSSFVLLFNYLWEQLEK